MSKAAREATVQRRLSSRSHFEGWPMGRFQAAMGLSSPQHEAAARAAEEQQGPPLTQGSGHRPSRKSFPIRADATSKPVF
jgi:hypothetical protein